MRPHEVGVIQYSLFPLFYFLIFFLLEPPLSRRMVFRRGSFSSYLLRQSEISYFSFLPLPLFIPLDFFPGSFSYKQSGAKHSFSPHY